ncbi:MAG: hypothetical protein AB1420_00360 [Bacillota bacterium]
MNKLRLTYNAILILAFTFIIMIPLTQAQASQVVIIDLGGLTIEELDYLPFNNLKKIIDSGGIGLMNTSTAGTRTRENGYITIGSGITNHWGNPQALVFSTQSIYHGELVGQIYKRLTGYDTPDEGAVVIDLPNSLRKVDTNKGKYWGTLGNILLDNNHKTAVIGTSNYFGNVHQEISLMLMNSNGVVSRSYFETTEDIQIGCLNMATNYDKLLEQFNYLRNEVSIIGIDMGDWHRISLLEEYAFPNVIYKTKEQIAYKQDEFIGNVVAALNPEEDFLILLSPSPTKQQNKNRNLLVPVIVWGKGVQTGLLTSPSTRRDGLITNLDILPSILKSLNITYNSHLSGRPIIYLDFTGDKLKHLLHLNESLRFTYDLRPTIVKSYIVLQIITISTALALIFYIPFYLVNLRTALLFLLSVPLALILVELITITNVYAYTLLAVLIALAISSISLYAFNNHSDSIEYKMLPFVVVCLGTSMFIILDLYFGSKLLKSSILGYDALAGARYYGIGNEYMGVLVGSSIIAVNGAIGYFKNNRYLLVGCIVYLTVVTALLISPNYGTNFGGSIAASFAFGYLILSTSSQKIRMKHLTCLLSFAAAFIMVIAFIDSLRDPAIQSHLGRTVNLAKLEGLEPIIEIATRKLQMNLKLLRYTIWSRVFILTLLALVIACFKPIYIIQLLRKDYPQIFRGFFAVVLGSVAALLTNDSGIVAAATMLIYAVGPMLYLAGLLYLKYKTN